MMRAGGRGQNSTAIPLDFATWQMASKVPPGRTRRSVPDHVALLSGQGHTRLLQMRHQPRDLPFHGQNMIDQLLHAGGKEGIRPTPILGTSDTLRTGPRP